VLLWFLRRMLKICFSEGSDVLFFDNAHSDSQETADHGAAHVLRARAALMAMRRGFFSAEWRALVDHENMALDHFSAAAQWNTPVVGLVLPSAVKDADVDAATVRRSARAPARLCWRRTRRACLKRRLLAPQGILSNKNSRRFVPRLCERMHGHALNRSLRLATCSQSCSTQRTRASRTSATRASGESF